MSIGIRAWGTIYHIRINNIISINPAQFYMPKYRVSTYLSDSQTVCGVDVLVAIYFTSLRDNSFGVGKDYMTCSGSPIWLSIFPYSYLYYWSMGWIVNINRKNINTEKMATSKMIELWNRTGLKKYLKIW